MFDLPIYMSPIPAKFLFVQGAIVSEWAGKTAIKSCARLTYAHAQRIIEVSSSSFAFSRLTA